MQPKHSTKHNELRQTKCDFYIAGAFHFILILPVGLFAAKIILSPIVEN